MRNHIQNAIRNVTNEMLYDVGVARSVVKYVDPKTVVKVTRRHRPDRRNRSESFVLTIGAPNYAERKFVKLCVKAGVRFPVSKMQYKFYPPKKARK